MTKSCENMSVEDILQNPNKKQKSNYNDKHV